MLPTVLSVIALVLLVVDAALIAQFASCLRKHREEPLQVHLPYLLLRLNAILINSFLIAAIQIALVLLR
jgi:hypothetical protein